MNKTYQLSLNLYDIYKEECLPNILSTLTKLDNIKENIFYDLNKGLQSRIDRLINCKSRINRVKQIISSLNNVTQAMMIKSKQYYPNEKINFPKNIYLEEDINGINNLIVSKREDTNPNNKKINSKPLYNPKENLLTNTKKFTIDNALIEETLISTMEKYNDISKELYETSLKNIHNIAKEEEGNNLIYEKVRYTNTEFSFFDKKLLQKATIPWEIRNDYETHRLSHVKEEINIRESKNKKKEIQEAPMSIQTGEKLTTYVVSKRNPIFQRSYTTENQLNIPTNLLNLKGVTDITNINPNNNTHVDELFTSKEQQLQINQEEDDNYQENIIEQEVDELPIDMIIERNQYKSVEINSNINNQDSTIQTTQVPNTVNNTLNTNTINTNTSAPNIPVVVAPQSGGNIPVAPPIPSVQVQPKVPQPPQLQTNQIQPTQIQPNQIQPTQIQPNQNIESNEGENEKVENNENEKNEDNEEKEEEEKKPVKKQLSMAEEMAMVKLKPKGSTKVEEIKPKPVSMMDGLMEQIKLRYQRLKEHEKENSDSEESEDD